MPDLTLWRVRFVPQFGPIGHGQNTLFGALSLGFILYSHPNFDGHLSVPFFKALKPDLGWFYVIFAMFVIVGASNAVNLTDGLDGLAAGPHHS